MPIVIVATQSPILVDYFEPEDVVVVDLVAGATYFKRLERAELEEWLADFSLGQLWEKNHLEDDRPDMVDFYGMPVGGNRAWPGRMEAAEMPQDPKGEHVAKRMLADLRKARPGENRLVPFVMLMSSKRPRYAKVAEGTAAMEAVTLARMTGECRHFARWLIRLRTLGQVA